MDPSVSLALRPATRRRRWVARGGGNRVEARLLRFADALRRSLASHIAPSRRRPIVTRAGEGSTRRWRVVAALAAIVGLPVSLFVVGEILAPTDALGDCGPNDLSMSVRSVGTPEAARLVVRIRNSGETCALVGAPAVELRQTGSAWDRPSQEPPPQTEVERWDGVLESGGFVQLTVVGGGEAPTRYEAIRVRLAAATVERQRLDLVIGTPLQVGPLELDSRPGRRVNRSRLVRPH